MQILNWQDTNYSSRIDQILTQSRVQDLEISEAVAAIINEVLKSKNKGLIKFTSEFDKINMKPDSFLFSENEINKAIDQISIDQRKAVDLAVKRINSSIRCWRNHDNFFYTCYTCRNGIHQN